MKSNWKTSFRALRYRNYRLFFAGQSISLVGSWMQRIAMGWLVYRLTDSPLMLGLVGFFSQIPSLFITPFSGVMIDRLDRRKILLTTQILAMAQAATLAALVLSGMVTVWWVLGLSLFSGFVDAWDHPVRQSFNVDMVTNRADIPNAVALNSTMFNAARLIGPAIAGILISLVGEGICFLVNAMSYIAVILCLLLMKVPARTANRVFGRVRDELRDGARYAFGFMPIRSVLLMLAIASFMGMPYTVLMPVFARDILHGDSRTLGFLVSCVGMGALTGAVFLATRKPGHRQWRVTPFSAVVFGAGLIAFSFSRELWVSFMLVYFVGLGAMVTLAGSNTVLQTIVADDKRGRVMGFQSMAFIGMAPLGSLWAGWVASQIGAPLTMAASGVVVIAGGVWFGMQRRTFEENLNP